MPDHRAPSPFRHGLSRGADLHRLLGVGARQTALLVTLVIFAVFALAVGDLFLSAGNFENLARQVSIDVPVVFGETIVLIAGGIDLSVGTTMAMSAILAIGLQPHGPLLASLCALLFGAAVGLLNGLLVARAKIVPFIVTLGTMSLTQGIMLTYTHQEPLSGASEAFTWVGGGNLGPLPVPLLTTLVLAGLVSLFLGATRAGRNLYAVGGDRDAAFLAGISIVRYQLLAYLASGVLAAGGGVLLASRLNSATVQLGNDTPLLAISAALIGGASLLGGRGGVLGALLGVLSLGMLTNGMNLIGIQTDTQIAVRAAILVTVVGLDALTRGLSQQRFAASGAGSK